MSVKPYTVVARLSSLQMQIDNCKISGNTEWLEKAQAHFRQVCRDFLPSGAGIDNGTIVESVADDKIILTCSYHHMHEGCYGGWTEHKITIRPCFYLGYRITISGIDRDDIKEYLADTYHIAVSQLIEWSDETQRYVAVSND